MATGPGDRLNALLRTLREVGRILNREKQLPALLQQVCDCLAKNRGFVGVWIGEPEAVTKKIIPRAGAAGESLEHLRQFDLRWDDSPQGQGPAGIAVRERRPVVFANITEHPGFAPWREHALALGANSVAAFPMMFQGRLFGVITVKSPRHHLQAFDPEEIELLTDLAEDVARAWQGNEDETALRQAEKANRESRDFHLKLLQSAPALIWRAGTDARCDWFNDTWLQFTGRTMNQECAEGWATGLHDEDRDECLRRYQAAFQQRQPFVLEYRLRRHDGEYRWITNQGAAFQDLAGEFAGYIGYGHDVHDARMTARMLAESEHRQRIILDNIPDPVWLKDLAGRYLAVNRAFYQKARNITLREDFEAGEAGILGKTSRDIMPAATAGKLRLHDEWIIANQQAREFEEELPGPNGETVILATYRSPIFDQTGRIMGSLGMGRNITVLKKSAQQLTRAKQELEQINAQLEQRVQERTQALASREEQLQRLFANMLEGIAGMHPLRDAQHQVADLRFGFVNPAFEKMIGVAGLTGKKLSELPPGLIPRSAEWLASIAGVAATGQPARWEMHLPARQVWLSVSAYQNGPDEVVGVFDDITAQKHYQAALEQNAAHLSQLVQTAPIPLCCFNDQGEFSQINECFLQLFGFPLGTPPRAAEWWATVLPNSPGGQTLPGTAFDAPELARRFGAHQLPCESALRGRDGAVLHLQLSCVQIEATLLVVFVDNTSDHIIQEVLLENEERWEYALSGAEDGVWDWEVPAAKVFYAIKWKEMLGYQDQEIGDSLAEFSTRVHPEDQPRVDLALQAHIDGQQPGFRAELRMRCRDGSYKWILTRGKIVKRGPAGQPLRIIGTHTDISSMKLTESALRESLAQEHLLSDVIEQSVMPFCIGNPSGQLTMVNQAYEKLTGFDRAELIGNPNWFQLVTSPEHLEISTRLARQSLLTRQSFSLEKEFFRKDGSRVPVELLVQPVFDEAGNHRHFRAFIQDISERKKAALALEAAMARAHEANEAKSEFLASLSHEIRTPLNAILGYTQILQREPDLSPATGAKLAIINRSGENLLVVLNDILDLAKIEAGKMSLQPVEFHLPELLGDLVRLYGPMAAEKGLALTLVPVPGLSPIIRADQTKLRQVLFNLLGNAIKFTERGGIELRVSLVQPAASGTELWLTVTDTGPGMAAEEQELLFEKFQQAQAGKMSLRGIGLGLALCRQFARLMGGEITLTSTLGVGSSFQVVVPVELAGGRDQPATRRAPAGFVLAPGQAPVPVLVVDDLHENREVLQTLLAGAGFVVEAVASGAAALTACRVKLPRLVLMDTRMPGMDGYETIRGLRAEFPAAALKIISVSAAAYATDQAAARQAGADDFIAKPVKASELFAKISQLLNLRTLAADRPADRPPSAETLAAAGAALPPAWCGELREALALGDFQQIHQLIDGMGGLHPVGASHLRDLANQYDTEAMLHLITNPTNAINPP